MPSRVQRRHRRFAEKLDTVRVDVADIKQRRPSAAAVTRFYLVDELGIGMSDSVSTTVVTDPVFSYSDPDRGYGYSEWADEYP